MPERTHRLLVAMMFVAAASTAATAGAAAITLEVTPRSRVVLDGRTNVNRWRCSGDSMSGGAAVSGSAGTLAHQLDAWEALPTGTRLEGSADLDATVELRVPIDGLGCGNRAMERDLRHALRAPTHPEIRYRFRGVREARFTPTAAGAPAYTLLVDGELTLAGSTRPVALRVIAARDGERFRLRGTLPLKMTDFGIRPPVALLGLIHAADELEVTLDVELVAPPMTASR
jgi:polyisoprenoid-binding protein YceI